MPTIAVMRDASQAVEVAELVEQAADGSDDAFAELVHRHHRSVRAYLGRFVKSADDADDLAQEVFLTAYRNLTGYEGAAPFGAWLMGIARHRALHHLRSELRRRRREGDPVRVVLAETRYEQAEELDVEDGQRENQALRECLDELPRNSRQLVSDFYFSQRSAEEIARERNAKGSAIRMTLLRIRRALADCIQRRVAVEETAP